MDIQRNRIHDSTKLKIEELQTAMFQCNKYWDRAMSVMSVKNAMQHFVSLAHPKIAHAYFFYADFFGDILSRYNITTIYDTVYREDKDISPLEYFSKNLENNLLVYDLFVQSIDVAIENKDYNVKVDLDRLLRVFNRFIDQAYLLYDKYVSTNNDAIFDGFADNYILDLDKIIAKLDDFNNGEDSED